MSDRLTIPRDFPKLCGVDFREDRAARLAAAKRDRAAAAMHQARLAVRCAWSKQQDFAGEYKPWLAAWCEALGVKDRQVNRWEAAGRTLIRHAANWAELHTWPLECLEMIGALKRDQVDWLIRRHADDPEVLDRDRLARYVADCTGGTTRRGRKQHPHQPFLPGIEQLLHFDAESLDPVDEARRFGAHFERFARSIEVHPEAVPDDELARAHAVAVAAADATAAEIAKRQTQAANAA